jgi:hypothetical protein
MAQLRSGRLPLSALLQDAALSLDASSPVRIALLERAHDNALRLAECVVHPIYLNPAVELSPLDFLMTASHPTNGACSPLSSGSLLGLSAEPVAKKVKQAEPGLGELHTAHGLQAACAWAAEHGAPVEDCECCRVQDGDGSLAFLAVPASSLQDLFHF